MPATKTRTPTPNSYATCLCGVKAKRKDMVPNENGRLQCQGCAAPPVRERRPRLAAKKDRMLWYVLAVEPGRGIRVRKELVKRAKVQDLFHLVGRVFSPSKLEERMVS